MSDQAWKDIEHAWNRQSQSQFAKSSLFLRAVNPLDHLTVVILPGYIECKRLWTL